MPSRGIVGPTIEQLARAIDAPLNVVAGRTGPSLDASTLAGLGVARISVGGSLARATLSFVEQAGRAMFEAGSFDYTSGALAHGELQARFAPRS